MPVKKPTTSATVNHARAPVQPRWSIRRFRFGTLAGPASVEFSFPTEGGRISMIMVPQSNLRHRSKLLDALFDRAPIFPKNVGASDTARFKFITDLVSSYTGPFELVPEHTGFIDIGTFATYSEVIHADGRRQPIPQSDAASVHPIADVRGTRKGAWTVLKLARHSTYLAFGIGVALAAPLPTYLKLRRDESGDDHSHLPETAVFNLSGRSSSGKTSVSMVGISLAGSPERAGTLNFTSRGLAELASNSNDLLLVLDDTEKAEAGSDVLVKALKSVVHTVPGGRSKLISRGVDQAKFPQLRWSTFGLSSSPRPISVLATGCGWDMTPGDQVRLFNIKVPSSKKGGIFDLIKGRPAKRAKRSVALITKLERGYQNHYGHVISQWVLYLMAQDRSLRVLGLVETFIQHIKPANDGWEIRFAQKFGYIYAAMVMGIEAGILPWKKDLPLQSARRCYRRARRAVMTEKDQFVEQAVRLSRLLRKKDRVIDSGASARRPVVLPERCIAIRYEKDGREKLGILDDALSNFLGTSEAKTKFTTALNAAGLIDEGHGHAGTVQERIKTERHGKTSDRIRVWSVDAKRLARFLKNSGTS